MNHARSILLRVARGEPDAVQECLDRYSGLVWSLVRKACRNHADAEEAVQEIFLDVWRSAPRFDASIAAEATFIAMIARRRLIDRNRRLGRQPDLEEFAFERRSGSAMNPVEDLSVREESLVAAEALEALRPEQQRVLRLSVYQGLSHEKIAEATGLPLGTVKTHVRRGLIRIRELLEGEHMPETETQGY